MVFIYYENNYIITLESVKNFTDNKFYFSFLWF